MTDHVREAILSLRAIDANSSDLEYDRERVLMDAQRFTRWAVHGDDVLLRTPGGVTLVRSDPIQGIVEFDHVARGSDKRIHFWMNANSVKELSDSLKLSRALQHAWPEPGQPVLGI